MAKNQNNILRKDAARSATRQMSTPNPLVPQGTNATPPRVKSNIKIAVATILAIHLVLFGGLLLQGCKRDNPQAAGEPTNALPNFDPNAFAAQQGAPPAGQPAQPPAPQIDPGLSLPVPAQPTTLPVPTPVPEVVPAPSMAPTEYVVRQGDSFEKIAKENGTTVKLLAIANPTADSRKLKIGQKLVLPPPSAPATMAALEPIAVASGFETYAVKSGDTLTKIASAKKTTIKALRAANNLKTDSIKVGQKLKIPVKAPVEPPPAVLPQPTVPGAVPNP